jgi:hypothetical protein
LHRVGRRGRLLVRLAPRAVARSRCASCDAASA